MSNAREGFNHRRLKGWVFWTIINKLPPAMHLRAIQLLAVGRVNPRLVSFEQREKFVFVHDCQTGEEIALASHLRAHRYVRIGLVGRKQRLIKRYLPSPEWRSRIPGSVVVDVGANIGEFSIACLDLGAKSVVAIEPDRNAIRALRRNMSDRPAEIHEVLLSDDDESLTFYYSTATADSSFIPPDRWSESAKLRSMRLDKLLAGRRIDVLKIDAEGAEPEVLQGARGLFPHIPFITVETSTERQGQSTFSACHEILTQAGFSCEKVRDGEQLLALR
jgi:FkbM family methyltransferase